MVRYPHVGKQAQYRKPMALCQNIAEYITNRILFQTNPCCCLSRNRNSLTLDFVAKFITSLAESPRTKNNKDYFGKGYQRSQLTLSSLPKETSEFRYGETIIQITRLAALLLTPIAAYLWVIESEVPKKEIVIICR